MSLDHIKKHAKNLHRLLPDFIAKHPDGSKLADCQELAARLHGFPSLHAAVASEQGRATGGRGWREPQLTPVLRQEVTYSAESELKHRASYWLADIGIHPLSKRALTAVVVVPLAGDSGFRDQNLLLNRDDVRQSVGEYITMTARTAGLPTPDLFALAVYGNPPEPDFWLTFRMKTLDTFALRTHVPAPMLNQALKQLETQGWLHAFERHVLRMALRSPRMLERLAHNDKSRNFAHEIVEFAGRHHDALAGLADQSRLTADTLLENDVPELETPVVFGTTGHGMTNFLPYYVFQALADGLADDLGRFVTRA